MFPYGIEGGMEGMGMGNPAPADLMWLMFAETGYPGYYMMYSDVNNSNEHDILD